MMGRRGGGGWWLVGEKWAFGVEWCEKGLVHRDGN